MSPEQEARERLIDEANYERGQIIARAREWNRTSPKFSSDNQCYDQAKALAKYLTNDQPWKYWSFKVIGGYKGLLPNFCSLHHHIMQADSSVKGAESFTLDPFQGPSNLFDHSVKASTPDKFWNEYPNREMQ